jgi:hypothetical protein
MKSQLRVIGELVIVAFCVGQYVLAERESARYEDFMTTRAWMDLATIRNAVRRHEDQYCDPVYYQTVVRFGVVDLVTFFKRSKDIKYLRIPRAKIAHELLEMDQASEVVEMRDDEREVITNWLDKFD